MEMRNVTWVLLADAKHGRLLRCRVTSEGRCHVEQCGCIRNTWPGHERHLTSPIWKNTNVTFGIEDDNREEEVNRFARRLVSWLRRQIDDCGIPRLVVSAPPRLLGVLRSSCRRRLPIEVEARRGELVNRDVSALREHPAIRGLVGSGRNTMR